MVAEDLTPITGPQLVKATLNNKRSELARSISGVMMFKLGTTIEYISSDSVVCTSGNEPTRSSLRCALGFYFAVRCEKLAVLGEKTSKIKRLYRIVI